MLRSRRPSVSTPIALPGAPRRPLLAPSIACFFVLLLLGMLAAQRATAASLPTPAVDQTAEVMIEITSPGPGQRVNNKVHIAPIRGVARSGAKEPLEFDVLIAVDVSKSTQYPSGIDVDEDEEVGINPHEELIAPGTYPDDVVCSDPGDTILAAEIKAAKLLLETLTPNRNRVGVIAFSGEVDMKTGERKHRDQQDAWVEVPLTADFSEVSRALDRILERGPHGATNFAAAIRLGVRELVGLTGAESTPRKGAKKVMQFLTDGVPTFPYGRGDQDDAADTEAALTAARLAKKAGLTINTFALGRHALRAPVATTEIARLTGGTFTPVRNPGEILAFLQGISFANIEGVVMTNYTTKEVSFDVSLSPDGSFSGFVPVQEGTNVIEVSALASDGGETTLTLELEFEKAGLTRHELAAELERTRRRNEELMLLLERRRMDEFRKRQQKKVTVTVE